MKFHKRIISLLLALVLLAGPLTTTAHAAGDIMYGIGFVTASALRLRSEPNTTSSTITTAPTNECVVVISKTGEWYKVNYNLQVGYMHEDYVSVLTAENAELGYGKVTGDRVNMRSGASTPIRYSACLSTCFTARVRSRRAARVPGSSTMTLFS